MTEAPPVSVVIPAHKRPVELKRAVAAVCEQDYVGNIEVVVVYDKAEPDYSHERFGARTVRVLMNDRKPGLAGARNTGILAASHAFVAFCDDDDYWSTSKLTQQMEVMERWPDAPLVTCSIAVNYDGKLSQRYAQTDLVTHDMLVRSRMAMLHSSTLLFRRASLIQLGLVSEDIPGSQNEDWDLLLRTAGAHDIPHIDIPLVEVTWGRGSFFSRRWDTKIDSSIWMLEHHPQIGTNNRAAARLLGQIAFAHACSGDRRQAWSRAAQAARRDPFQWRAPLSVVVALLPASGEKVLGVLHAFGRGV